MTDPLRVSDDERDRVIRELTRHCGDGRLTLDELEDRVTETYAAATHGELEHALRELPKQVPVRQSGPPIRVKATPSHAGEVALKAHLYTYVSVITFLVMIYVLTNFGGYFWPVWPAMGWGVGLAVHAGVEKAKAGH